MTILCWQHAKLNSLSTPPRKYEKICLGFFNSLTPKSQYYSGPTPNCLIRQLGVGPESLTSPGLSPNSQVSILFRTHTQLPYKAIGCGS